MWRIPGGGANDWYGAEYSLVLRHRQDFVRLYKPTMTFIPGFVYTTTPAAALSLLMAWNAQSAIWVYAPIYQQEEKACTPTTVTQ